MIRNPNAGIPKLINANAFTAGCIMPKPVAIRVGNVANIEKSFLSLRKKFGKYLLGKNIQKPAMYTHKIANSSKSWPITHKINLYIRINFSTINPTLFLNSNYNMNHYFLIISRYIFIFMILTNQGQSGMKICTTESYYHQ